MSDTSPNGSPAPRQSSRVLWCNARIVVWDVRALRGGEGRDLLPFFWLRFPLLRGAERLQGQVAP